MSLTEKLSAKAEYFSDREHEEEQSEELCERLNTPHSPQPDSSANVVDQDSLQSQLNSLALKVSPETQQEIAKVLESLQGEIFPHRRIGSTGTMIPVLAFNFLIHS